MRNQSVLHRKVWAGLRVPKCRKGPEFRARQLAIEFPEEVSLELEVLELNAALDHQQLDMFDGDSQDTFTPTKISLIDPLTGESDGFLDLNELRDAHHDTSAEESDAEDFEHQSASADFSEEEELAISVPQPSYDPATLWRTFDFRSRWSYDECVSMHEALLESSLHQLMSDRTAPFDRMDVLVWVQMEEQNKPFSFDACCLLQGANPEEVRQSLISRLLTDYPDFPIPHKIEVKKWNQAVKDGQASSLKFYFGQQRPRRSTRPLHVPTFRNPKNVGLPTLSLSEVFL